MAAPRKYPEELRERASRFALELVNGPERIYDEASQSWVSNAEVAEIDYTAFASKAKAQRVIARLIVRRVPDLGAAPQDWRVLVSACPPPLLRRRCRATSAPRSRVG